MEDVAGPATQVGGGGGAVPAAQAGGGAIPAAAAQGRGGEGEAEEHQEIHKEDEEEEEEDEEVTEMHADLLRAATAGDSESMRAMVQHSQDPSILLGTTPSGNTCLHISCIHGHQDFCKDVITLEQSLLTKTNLDGETPLVVAVTVGHTSLASLLLVRCHELGLRQAILQQDRHGFNALHRAIRNGHQDLALELIRVEPALSQGVSKCNQSPMFIAVMKDFTQIFEALLGIPNSAHVGQHRQNVLHAAATNENSVVAKRIMEDRPELAKEDDKDGCTPIQIAVRYNKVDVVRVLLEHDSSLGYEGHNYGIPLLCLAAAKGQVGVARELLKHCPDALYRNVNVKGQNETCLHIAVCNGHREFVEFILRTPQLQKLVNMQDIEGQTALHVAIRHCDPRVVAALLSHKNIDTTILDNNGESAASRLLTYDDWHDKSLAQEVRLLMLKSDKSTATGASGGMDKRLLRAATAGDSESMRAMVHSQDPSILLQGTTPSGNTCLHISSIHGHQEFCDDVLTLQDSLLSNALLSNVNSEGETPLVIAVTLGHTALASLLLGRCHELGLRQAILRQDRYGFNALHHAIRNGHQDLALELIVAEPALSQAVSNYNESPMFIAVMRDFTDVFKRLVEISDSSDTGKYGRHVLHAAARNGNSVVATKIMEKRPQLATEADIDGFTPIRMAVSYNKVEVLRVLLGHDSSLGYEVDNHGYPLLCCAADRGQVGVARELFNHRPDALYRVIDDQNWTCLHIAVQKGHPEFVEFILRTPQLQKLVNMQDSKGKTALHYAIEQCDPKLVAALLSHKNIDTTILDNGGNSAASRLSSITDEEKTLYWKEVHVLMLKADPKDDDISLYNLYMGAKQRETIESKRHRKSLTQKYTSNTSLVAILLATITFTAAFTLPGGYSSDSGSAGLPIMSRKTAFQAFLVSDTLAMCSSFVVAFICLMGKWEDDEFTSYYISITKKLTWFAYMTTITAFSTGLYTVLASHLHWLAIGICSLIAALPVLTIFIGKWPFLKLNFRLGTWPALRHTFRFCPTWHVLKLKFKSLPQASNNSLPV